MGPNINIRDNYDHTPLHYAKLHGNMEVFKELLKLGAVVNISRYLISRYEKDIIEIVECADYIYFNQAVNILPLIRVSSEELEDKSLSYNEALEMIQARLKNLILYLGYPKQLQLQIKSSLDKVGNEVYNDKHQKIHEDLQKIIDSIKLPTKKEIGEEIEVYLAILLYSNAPERFSSSAPISIVKNGKIKNIKKHDSVYTQYKNEYPHYKTKKCFDYLVDEKNYNEILPVLLADDNSRKLLFNNLKKTALNQEDFNKFRVLYNKVVGLLNKLDSMDTDIRLLYEIRKQQHKQVVECFAELKEKFTSKEEECIRLSNEVINLQSKLSHIAKTEKVSTYSKKNNVNYKGSNLSRIVAT